MSLKIRPTDLWMALLSCSFILLSSNRFMVSASPVPRSAPAAPLKLAQFNIKLPNLGIPGVPSVEEVVKGAIADQVTQAMGRTVQTEAPIVSSAEAVFPTV